MSTENEVKGAAAPSQFTDTAALDQLATEATAQATDTPSAPQSPRLTAADCMTEAGMLIGMGLQIISVKLGVVFDKPVQEEGAKKLAAVLAKYNGKLPDWYTKYAEEFALGFWCAGVAWRCYEEWKIRQAIKNSPSANDQAPERAAA